MLIWGSSVKRDDSVMDRTAGSQWRAPSFWWQLTLLGGIRLGCFLFQMLENLLNDLRIFDAGNHFDVTAAVFADFNINIEDSLEAVAIQVMGAGLGALQDSCHAS
ncbi:hypothetical protein MS6194_04027 [Escherichia coli]|nr:hypothetical protein [Escherichia coli]